MSKRFSEDFKRLPSKLQAPFRLWIEDLTGEEYYVTMDTIKEFMQIGYQFMGIAQTYTQAPQSITDNMAFYIATTAGTYTYFGNIVVNEHEVALLLWNGTTWVKQLTNIAHNSALSNKQDKAILNVTVTQTTTTDLNYTFSIDNFNAVKVVAATGQPVSVRITDNRSATYKIIDLGKIWPAVWNTTLQQVEVDSPAVARGFYLNSGAIANRGCTSHNTSMYVSAGATFNAVSGFYELNGLVDITEAQMEVIYSEKPLLANFGFYATKYRGRTTLPIISDNYAGLANIFNYTTAQSWFYGTTAEIIRLHSNMSDIEVNRTLKIPNTCIYLIRGCPVLREVSTILDISDCTNLSIAFTCPLLSTIYLKGLRISCSFSSSPNLSENSCIYMIKNAGSATFSITLHADAYNRVMANSEFLSELSFKPNITIIRA